MIRLLRQMMMRVNGSWSLPFTFSICVHAGIIGAAFYFVSKAVRPSPNDYQPPELVMQKGWAVELEGLDAGATPVNISGAQLPAVSAKADLEMPGNDAPPDVTPPPIDANVFKGTAEKEPLPDFGPDQRPPVNLRSAPAPADGSTGGSPDAIDQHDQPAGNPSAQTTSATGAPDQAAGTAQAGTGSGAGGGIEGVPEGMPVPSVRNKIPPYPPEALRNGWTGTVLLELTIDSLGQVSSAKVLRSSRHEMLDRSALETAKTWQFIPARLNGKAIALTLTRDVNFTLPSR